MDNIVVKQFAIELRNMDEGDFFEGRLESFAIFPTEEAAWKVFEQLRSQYALPRDEEFYTPFYVLLADYAQEIWLEGGLPKGSFSVSAEDAQAIKAVLKQINLESVAS